MNAVTVRPTTRDSLAEIRRLRDCIAEFSGMLADLMAASATADTGREVMWRQLCRESWQDGYRVGESAGREAEAREREAAWARITRPIASGPAHAELERRRWTVHGEQRTRETFGQPHPLDRPVRAATTTAAAGGQR